MKQYQLANNQTNGRIIRPLFYSIILYFTPIYGNNLQNPICIYASIENDCIEA